jgi:hypothetical protein
MYANLVIIAVVIAVPNLLLLFGMNGKNVHPLDGESKKHWRILNESANT